MATTYARIRAALGEMNTRAHWTPDNLKKALIARDKKRNESMFSVKRGGARKPAPFSDAAFNRLFSFMTELTLITRTAGEELTIESSTAKSLVEDKRFQELVTRKIMGYLEDHGTNLTKIRAAAQKIQLPDTRDPKTILEKLKADGLADQLSAPNFSRVLFLLACAKSRAARHMKIFYEFP